MKTIKIIAIAAAVTALAACTKEQGTDNGSSFKKGQEVTLSVTADIPATKVTSAFNSDGTTVDFKWEDGDQIKITVDDSSAVFTLVGDAGTSSAHFEGKMPESGTKFDIQYPVEEPDLTSQSYTAGEAIPHGMMKFTATGCKIGDATFNIVPQYAAMRLNLYGGARSVSQIAVTNNGTSETYTLTCSPAKVVGKDKDNATPFFIVVPVGSGSWNFSAAVNATEVTSTTDNTVSYESSGLGTVFSLASTTFTPATEQSFTAGGVLDMPAESLTTVWAPVNCGYDASHTYGLLYQWGRKVGGGYNTTEGNQTTTAATYTDGYNKNPDDSKFYTQSSSPYDWYTNASSKQLSAWPMTSSDAGYVDGKIANPCPTGWRVPTYEEFKALITYKSSWTTNTVGGVSQNGYWLSGGTAYSESVPRVFLPAAGYRDSTNGSVSMRGSWGMYWSSSVTSSKGWCMGWRLFFSKNSGGASMSSYYLASGYSVRCVQE